jgi:hypothetical protein
VSRQPLGVIQSDRQIAVEIARNRDHQSRGRRERQTRRRLAEQHTRLFGWKSDAVQCDAAAFDGARRNDRIDGGQR